MTPNAARFGLLAFVVLTGALATNIFVLQPPGRQVARGDGSTSWVSRSAPSDFGHETASATSTDVPSAHVPPLETGAVRPLPATGDQADLVRAIQRELSAKGYETGAVDGVPGLVTRAAIMAYESDVGLPLTAEPREAVLQHIILGSGEDSSVEASAPPPGPEAEGVIRAVQRALRQLGYMTSFPDGRLNQETRHAIRRFEADRKLKSTGRISGELVARLASLAGEALRTAER